MATAGAAVALNYGYNWLTGQKLQYRTMTNTGLDTLDYTRVGFWLLGEGEMDGLVEMWDTGLGKLLFLNEYDNTNALHWHPGADAGGSGSTQEVDGFWDSLAPGLTALTYNRWAYYAIRLKQFINNPPNTDQSNPDNFTDVNPIGLWRGIRCRFFDNTGTLSNYAFTRNPAWHFVDLICRRRLFVEYSISPTTGADDLPAAVRNRFDWGAIADSAAYYDEALDNGRPRFSGDYSFSQQATLQACLTQILTCSRSFIRERSGTFAIVADKPRSSVFMFSRDNADSFTPSDADTHSAPNVNTSKFRDLLVPAFATIAYITCTDHTNPVVTTAAAHSAVANDYIVIGNTGTKYDGYWQVDSVPAGDSVLSMTLKSKGSNYPASVGAGGLIGFRFSRFKDRSPQFQHKAHQLTQGAIGVGIPRFRNKVPETTDFANCTWDQVSRVSVYQRGIALGPDTTPYVAPIKATVKVPLFAPDASGSGAVALQIEPGDVVTINDTLSPAYAGLYEVMPVKINLTGSAPAQGTSRTPSAGGLELTLRPYSDANYPDAAPSAEPGWPDVPTMPGTAVTSTKIPLANGSAVFFTGSGANGDSFEMPNGYTQDHMLCWASPQGFIEADQHLHFIQDCDAYSTRRLTLVYNDSAGSTWGGDVNFAGIAWQTEGSASTSMYGGISYVELTLLGGEKILIGKGIYPSGSRVSLPAGYYPNLAIGFAYPKYASDSGHPAHGFATWLDSNGYLHHRYQDGEGNIWEGYGQIFIVAIKNNLGTWKRDATTGWYTCPLTNGEVLAIAGHSVYDAAMSGTKPTVYPDTLNNQVEVTTGAHIPACPGMAALTAQCMPGTNGFNITDHDAHGVKECLVDDTLAVSNLFEDGEGNSWPGSAHVFTLLCDTPTGTISGDPLPTGTGTWGDGTDPGVGMGGGGGSDPGSGGSTQVLKSRFSTPQPGSDGSFDV